MSDPNMQIQSTEPTQTTLPPTGEAAPAAAPEKARGTNMTPAKAKAEFREPPHQAFMNRVKREAAMEVKRRLGVTIEDAEAIVKQTKEQPAGDGKSASQNTADAAVVKAQKEIEKLRAESAAVKKQLDDVKRKHDKEIRRLKDKEFEAKLAAQAARAGILDTDYALTLYAREVAANPSLEADGFFAGLRDSKPFLFTAQTAAPAPTAAVVAPTTAPRESAAPGEAVPVPTPAGAKAPAKTADDMSPEEFNQHLRRSGWTPGS